MHDGLMGHEGLVETGLAPTTIEYLNEEQLRELLFNRWKRGIVKCCSSVFGGKIAPMLNLRRQMNRGDGLLQKFLEPPDARTLGSTHL